MAKSKGNKRPPTWNKHHWQVDDAVRMNVAKAWGWEWAEVNAPDTSRESIKAVEWRGKVTDVAREDGKMKSLTIRWQASWLPPGEVVHGEGARATRFTRKYAEESLEVFPFPLEARYRSLYCHKPVARVRKSRGGRARSPDSQCSGSRSRSSSRSEDEDGGGGEGGAEEAGGAETDDEHVLEAVRRYEEDAAEPEEQPGGDTVSIGGRERCVNGEAPSGLYKVEWDLEDIKAAKSDHALDQGQAPYLRDPGPAPTYAAAPRLKRRVLERTEAWADAGEWFKLWCPQFWLREHIQKVRQRLDKNPKWPKGVEFDEAKWWQWVGVWQLCALFGGGDPDRMWDRRFEPRGRDGAPIQMNITEFTGGDNRTGGSGMSKTQFRAINSACWPKNTARSPDFGDVAELVAEWNETQRANLDPGPDLCADETMIKWLGLYCPHLTWLPNSPSRWGCA